ncbi:serine/threonine-protein kinase Nek4-like isoform X2 [Macrobrachium nipponense]
MEDIEVIKEIGRGSYGSVWLVSRITDRRLLVLKSVKLSHLNSEEEKTARQEVHILAGLKHPNIVSYKGSFEMNHHLHLLMTYCEGGDLFTKIRHQHRTLFPEQQIIRWFIQITMALQYLHSHNILHRDLKTQNIFLTRSGLIKLGDFGIARVLNSSMDLATTMIGTPYYMSPELFSGIPYSYKSDVWALGCCLYELITLKHAFVARDLSALICRISRGKVEGISSKYTDELRSLVLSLLSRSPNLRPSASQILHKPFIREHISTFLKDTTAPSCVDDKKDFELPSKVSLRYIQKNKNFECRHIEEEKHFECHVPNVLVKRCCEVLPTEFASLHIAGDKMKLENRSRMEVKPSGVKECQCKRREKIDVHAACQIGSQSRRRRRIKRAPSSESEPHENFSSSIPFQGLDESPVNSRLPENDLPYLSSSARVRRRQRRDKEIDIKVLSDLPAEPNLVELNSNNDKTKVCDSSSSEGECNSENSPRTQDAEAASTEKASPIKSDDIDDFVSMLDTTLKDSFNFESDTTENMRNKVTVTSDCGMDLSCRLSMLEETLMKSVDEEQAALILSVVKSGFWDDWDEQHNQARNILGDQKFAAVSSTLCHLKLCYCFMQE